MPKQHRISGCHGGAGSGRRGFDVAVQGAEDEHPKIEKELTLAEEVVVELHVDRRRTGVRGREYVWPWVGLYKLIHANFLCWWLREN